MKRKYILNLIILACAILMVSCERKDLELIPEIEIQFEMPESINDLPIDESKRVYANREVIIKGSTMEYKVMTDATGKVVLKNVFPDVYSVATSWQLSESEYNDLTDQNVNLELGTKLLLSGNRAKIELFDNSPRKEEIIFNSIKSLIISKVYYSQSKDKDNKKVQTDTYVELYNNFSEPISLDNLYLGVTETLNDPPAFLAKNNPNFIYLRQIVAIPPGYVLNGYTSLLIACRVAKDYTINAPNSVDLLKADFEVKKNDSDGEPSVKSATVIFNSSGTLAFLNLLASGENGIVIFKTEEDVTQWEILPPPDRPTYNQKFKKVDNRIIMDGVECLAYKATGLDIQLKRINNSIDASYTFITGGTGSNEACERRVERVFEIDGKKVYELMDTNNSLNDFRMTKADIRPRIYDKPELMPQ